MDEEDFLSLGALPVEGLSVDAVAADRLEALSFDQLAGLDMLEQRLPGGGIPDLGGGLLQDDGQAVFRDSVASAEIGERIFEDQFILFFQGVPQRLIAVHPGLAVRHQRFCDLPSFASFSSFMANLLCGGMTEFHSSTISEYSSRNDCM